MAKELCEHEQTRGELWIYRDWHDGYVFDIIEYNAMVMPN
jgi:hypothetical protein